MNMERFDPVSYKTELRESWNTTADKWEKWWYIIEKGANCVSEHLLNTANVESGLRVLDVATGNGEPAIAAAKRVGNSGHVTAVDQSIRMLANGKKRAAKLGLINIDFIEMDMEYINMPKESFDAVLCRWGLMFLTDIENTLHRLRQLLKPRGYFAASVWDIPQKAPMISLASGLITKALEAPPPPEGTPDPFSLADVEHLKNLLSDCGFKNITFKHISVPFSMSSISEYIDFATDLLPERLTQMLEDIPKEKRDDIWQSVAEAAKKYAKPNREIYMPCEAIAVSARVE